MGRCYGRRTFLEKTYSWFVGGGTGHMRENVLSQARSCDCGDWLWY